MAILNKITLTTDGGSRELSANYLGPAALEYWYAWLANESRMAYNPFAEFATKVQALPEDLRGLATREFVAGINFDIVPKLVLMNTMRSLPAVQVLCVLVTGENAATEENYKELFPQLFSYIVKQEVTVDSLAEVNALRAKLGKPPLGQPAGKPAPSGPSNSGQSPQGG